MKCTSLILLPFTLLAACQQQPEGEPVVTVELGDADGVQPLDAPVDLGDAGVDAAMISADSSCKPATFEGVELTHCIADPAKHLVNVIYQAEGAAAPYGTLGAFAETADASTIAFAMNGGAFSDDLTPKGYLVSSRNRLSELDRGDGDGNFYMKPNGVLFGTGARWRILTTERFFRTVRDRPAFGTQSGPMLLVDGELGGAISENGNSRAIRNGVGVDSEGKAHFVISGAPISYGQLARYLRDEAGATDALFLDANSSALWDPASGRMDAGRTGPIIVVSKKTEQ